jgi:translation initiation factor 5B
MFPFPSRSFHLSSAIILGVDIIDGTLRIGTPLCVIKINPETKKREVIKLGQMCVFLLSLCFVLR